MDQFLKELMSSVYESLSVTDRQLYLINDRLGGGSNAYVGAERESMKALIAKTLNDLFVEKMDTSMGFTVDFKETCEIISIYYMVCLERGKSGGFQQGISGIVSAAQNHPKTGYLLPGTHQHGG